MGCQQTISPPPGVSALLQVLITSCLDHYSQSPWLTSMLPGSLPLLSSQLSKQPPKTPVQPHCSSQHRSVASHLLWDQAQSCRRPWSASSFSMLVHPISGSGPSSKPCPRLCFSFIFYFIPPPTCTQSKRLHFYLRNRTTRLPLSPTTLVQAIIISHLNHSRILASTFVPFYFIPYVAAGVSFTNTNPTISFHCKTLEWLPIRLRMKSWARRPVSSGFAHISDPLSYHSPHKPCSFISPNHGPLPLTAPLAWNTLSLALHHHLLLFV